MPGLQISAIAGDTGLLSLCGTGAAARGGLCLLQKAPFPEELSMKKLKAGGGMLVLHPRAVCR